MELCGIPNRETLRFFIPTLVEKLKTVYKDELDKIEAKIQEKLAAQLQGLKAEGMKNPAVVRVIIAFDAEKSDDAEIQGWVAKKNELTALMFPTSACYNETWEPIEQSLFFAFDITPNDVFNMCDPEKVMDLGPNFATVLSGEELTKFRQHLVSRWEKSDRLSATRLAAHVVKCASCERNLDSLMVSLLKNVDLHKIADLHKLEGTRKILEAWSGLLNEKYRSLLILLKSAERTGNEIVISPVLDERLII